MTRRTAALFAAVVTAYAGPGAPADHERETSREATPIVRQPRIAVAERVVAQPATPFQNPVTPQPTTPGTFSRPQSTFQTPAGSFSRPATTFQNPAAPYVPVPRPIIQNGGIAGGHRWSEGRQHRPRHYYGYPSVVVVPVEVPVPVVVETIPVHSEVAAVAEQPAQTQQTEIAPVVVDLPPGARIIKPASVATKVEKVADK